MTELMHFIDSDYFYLIPAALFLIIGIVILRYERINKPKKPKR